MKKLLLSLALSVAGVSAYAAQGTITVSGTLASTLTSHAVTAASCTNNESLSSCIAELDSLAFSGSTVSVGTNMGDDTLTRYFAVRTEGQFIAFKNDSVSVLASVSSVELDGATIALNSSSSPLQVRLKYLRFKQGGLSTWGQNYLGAGAAKITAGGSLVNHPATNVLTGANDSLLLSNDVTAQVVWEQAGAACGANEKVMYAYGAGNKFIVEAVYEIAVGEEAQAGNFSANINMGLQVINN